MIETQGGSRYSPSKLKSVTAGSRRYRARGFQHAANERRRVCNDRPLVASVLLVLWITKTARLGKARTMLRAFFHSERVHEASLELEPLPAPSQCMLTERSLPGPPI
jgi:hypothetical protein